MQKIFLVVSFCALLALCASLDGPGSRQQYVDHSASAAEVPLTQDTVHVLTASIRHAGYDCPLVKTAYDSGQDARGPVYQVWCGPADREGAFAHLHFRVTVLNDNSVLVKPWNE